MSSTRPHIFTQPCSNKQGWDYAIFVAEGEIREAEEKIRRLKFSIQTFEEMRDKGETFPGESAEQGEATGQ